MGELHILTDKKEIWCSHSISYSNQKRLHHATFCHRNLDHCIAKKMFGSALSSFMMSMHWEFT